LMIPLHNISWHGVAQCLVAAGGSVGCTDKKGEATLENVVPSGEEWCQFWLVLATHDYLFCNPLPAIFQRQTMLVLAPF
jgi:hypothetical protein